MKFEHLEYELSEQGVATIRFNEPEKRNAMTVDMGEELIAAAGHVAAEPEARVLVLTGAGKAFSAGGDMNMIRKNTEKDILENQFGMKAFYSRFLKIRDVPIPTVASINGAAIGAGLCVALACDIRLAAEDALLAGNFTALGLHPGMGATWLLPRIVGMPMAAELLFSSRRIDGREAERIGLVNRALPASELADATQKLAREIAECAPIAVRLTKRSLLHAATNTLDEQLDVEASQQAITFGSEDVREGLKAVAEKRKPDFRGR